jgi:hypothetical protein
MTDNEANASLAQPEPEGPTDEAVEAAARVIYGSMRFDRIDHTVPWVERGNSFAQDEARRCARAVLARWGRPAIQPVAVSERPWEREGWCDAEGRCWWFNRAGIPEWQLASDGPYGDFSLPHNALPVPGAEVQS